MIAILSDERVNGAGLRLTLAEIIERQRAEEFYRKNFDAMSRICGNSYVAIVADQNPIAIEFDYDRIDLTSRMMQRFPSKYFLIRKLEESN